MARKKVKYKVVKIDSKNIDDFWNKVEKKEKEMGKVAKIIDTIDKKIYFVEE